MQKPDILEHGTELRVITRFTAALNENKEAEFRRTISTRFENSALRAPDSFRDLEILKLPKGELEIVESTTDDQGRCETVAREKPEPPSISSFSSKTRPKAAGSSMTSCSASRKKGPAPPNPLSNSWIS